MAADGSMRELTNKRRARPHTTDSSIVTTPTTQSLDVEEDHEENWLRSVNISDVMNRVTTASSTDSHARSPYKRVPQVANLPR